MHPSYYSGSAVPLSPSQQMAGYRHLQSSTPSNAGQTSLVRPQYLNVDVSPFVGMQGPHVPSPTGYPPPPFVVQRFPQYGQQNSPASGSSQMGMVSRPPPVYTGANDTVIHDQTLRSLQERVAQIAAIPRLTAQELAALNAQHITPRSIGDNRMLMQEVTHLNPPGAVRPMHHVSSARKLTATSSSSSLNEYFQGRLTPGERNAKIPYLATSNTPLGSPAHGLLPMPPPPMKASSSPSSASRYIGPTEEELRKLNELMPTGDDPDSRKSVEEWKKFRLRVMSRLRKQRWRAKKKAEVLAGIEDTQREEAERKRRDRLRKQEQRAKKKQRAMEDSSSGGDDNMDSSSQRTDSPSTAPSESVSSITANASESVAEQQPEASPPSASTGDEAPESASS